MLNKLIITTVLCVLCQLPSHCSTIFSITQNDGVYVGNNEDWTNPNPKYRIIPATAGTYGKIIFSFDNNWGRGGMNEKGLFFDWISESEETSWNNDLSKQDFKGNLSEKILSECTTIDEALSYYENYNDPQFKNSFTVLVDSSGQSALVFWDDDKLRIQKCKGRCVWGYGGSKVVDMCKNMDGPIEQHQMTRLLNTAHQKGEYPTLYSNLYDLKNRHLKLFYYHNFEEEVVIDLLKELKRGKQSVELKTIFKTQIPDKEYKRLQRQYVREELESVRQSVWIDLASIGTAIIMVFGFIYFYIKQQRLKTHS